ncbi:MAG TPA: hypothetical protein DEB73_03380 [Candidatus Magasanikbacteria bacterium]|uniref:Uncharacterized protein n=2 Tax=Candidatus Magasanikiibacteriota TaxID=1752731 RepID=A0A0G0WJW8_9BACT|nr:MAG: hypothetical protein UU49_C0011G0024 [Candidatus Magasanikbacteria bacterium GW2011_GWC2_41_17]KKS13120.1 MAG: hypothetical protein UU69_C0013G0010 [Candidatus Magasanikbacteria bacterium GW2011_GWA2_41_55]HBV58273.1 hypothetical protein [Candidatus Magasanikbacteria bacterium]HBX16067.1 hypothetical protein [Candidatus Magasanikbacteria bacterium]
MEHCVQYALAADEVTRALGGFSPSPTKLCSILNGSRWEVWKGLPTAYGFEEAHSHNDDIGWAAIHSGVHIWVAPPEYAKLKRLPDMQAAVLMVFCEGDARAKRRCDVFLADMEGNDLDKAIARAQTLNAELIAKPKPVQKRA